MKGIYLETSFLKTTKILKTLETFLIRVIAQSKFISLTKSTKSLTIICFLFIYFSWSFKGRKCGQNSLINISFVVPFKNDNNSISTFVI